MHLFSQPKITHKSKKRKMTYEMTQIFYLNTNEPYIIKSLYEIFGLYSLHFFPQKLFNNLKNTHSIVLIG